MPASMGNSDPPAGVGRLLPLFPPPAGPRLLYSSELKAAGLELMSFMARLENSIDRGSVGYNPWGHQVLDTAE